MATITVVINGPLVMPNDVLPQGWGVIVAPGTEVQMDDADAQWLLDNGWALLPDDYTPPGTGL